MGVLGTTNFNLENVTHNYKSWRNACSVLLGKLEGKKLLGRPQQRWKNNIKMYLKK
jgi:RNase P/RNase MRP subunit p29